MRIARSSVPAIQAAFGAAPGHSAYGRTRGTAVDREQHTRRAIGLAEDLVFVHDQLAAVGIPGAIAEHGIDPDGAPVLPHVDAPGASHGRDRGLVELVPTERVGRVGQRAGVRGVLVVDDGAVAAKGARAGSESRADVRHLLMDRRLGQPFTHFGEVVEPANEDETGDQRGPGQVVEQQVQGAALRRLVG